MFSIELVLVVLAAIAVSSVAARAGLQAPLILVAVGAAVSFIPALPQLVVPPEIILGFVLPPLLYSTAIDFSFINFVRNLWPIFGLGVLLVVVTAGVVGLTAGWLIPALTLQAGLVLGAVVAPPDAVTAVAIGRRLGLPKRVMTILTGESLVNDAAALTVFAITLTAVTGGHAFIGNPVLFFGYNVVVGVLIGMALALVVLWVRRRLDNPGLETVLGLVLPFAAYLAAEEAHASGVLAVVMAAFAMGHNADQTGYAARLQERYVWRSIDVLLEAFVFAYMGLQLRFLLDDVAREGKSVPKVLLGAGLILVVVMIVRVVWVLSNHARQLLGLRFYRRQMANNDRFRAAQERRRRRRIERGRPQPEPYVRPLKHDVVISWTGMRGVVTLAAAAGIPLVAADGAPFPGRADIQVIAFVVAVGTLVVQGSTLPALIRRLRLEHDEEDERGRRQREHAQQVSRSAAQDSMRASFTERTQGVDAELVQQMADRWRQAQQARQRMQFRVDEGDDRSPELRQRIAEAFDGVRLDMVSAQRKALTAERDAFRLDDDLYRELMEQLDFDEAATANRSSNRLS